jgi:hypothetical protein
LLLIIPFRRLSDAYHLTARAERVEIKAFRFASLNQRIGIRLIMEQTLEFPRILCSIGVLVHKAKEIVRTEALD